MLQRSFQAIQAEFEAFRKESEKAFKDLEIRLEEIETRLEDAERKLIDARISEENVIWEWETCGRIAQGDISHPMRLREDHTDR
jgi:hypothetical protein